LTNGWWKWTDWMDFLPELSWFCCLARFSQGLFLCVGIQ
jgi:hypothetical protein